MTEALLQYLWKFRLFNATQLQTKSGEGIQVIHQGMHNHDSGPDFLNAKIRIGNKVWAGNVELHIQSSEWYQHKHQLDNAYNNVILHVVFEGKDDFVATANDAQIPCVELKGRIDENLLSRYETLMRAANVIPCAGSIAAIDSFTVYTTIERMAIERLESKVQSITQILNDSNGDWEHTSWQLLARYLGSGINRDAMEATVRKIPVQVLSKHTDNALQIEAMLFGVAGLLTGSFMDDYPRALQKEFNYLKRLHSLETIGAGVFRWAKTRPANFPTVRLAQLATLMASDVKLFSKLLHCHTVSDLQNLLTVGVHPYWKNHFRFDEPADKGVGSIGKSTVHIVVINALAPLLFAFGKHKGEEKYCEMAIAFLQSTAAEENAITRVFQPYNIMPQSAFDSQGLIQLKQQYCTHHACLNCAIGNSILRGK